MLQNFTETFKVETPNPTFMYFEICLRNCMSENGHYEDNCEKQTQCYGYYGVDLLKFNRI